jgi:hypothetical protein
MRGESPEAVSTLLLQQEGLKGLQVRGFLPGCLVFTAPTHSRRQQPQTPHLQNHHKLHPTATNSTQPPTANPPQGPTVSPVYTMGDGADGRAAQHGFYACVICVPKKKLYASVKILQKVGVGEREVSAVKLGVKRWVQAFLAAA